MKNHHNFDEIAYKHGFKKIAVELRDEEELQFNIRAHIYTKEEDIEFKDSDIFKRIEETISNNSEHSLDDYLEILQSSLLDGKHHFSSYTGFHIVDNLSNKEKPFYTPDLDNKIRKMLGGNKNEILMPPYFPINGYLIEIPNIDIYSYLNNVISIDFEPFQNTLDDIKKYTLEVIENKYPKLYEAYKNGREFVNTSVLPLNTTT